MPAQNWIDVWESDCPAPKVPSPPPPLTNRTGPAVHFSLLHGQWCGRSTSCRKADGDRALGGIQPCGTAVQCEARCQALERCRSFDWQAGKCYLWDCIASDAHAVTTPTTCGNCTDCPAGVAPSPPHVVDNPCVAMYERFWTQSLRVPNGSIGGFSQRLGDTPLSRGNDNYVLNEWLPDGTPIFTQPASLWYPMHSGCPSNLSLDAQSDCIEARLKRVAANNTARPLFVPTYGVMTFADVALEMAKRLPTEEWAIVGMQDFAALGREAAGQGGRDGHRAPVRQKSDDDKPGEARNDAHSPESDGATVTASFNASNYFVWHLTDVHVDPWYTVGADASRCYCEIDATCPQAGANCHVGVESNTSAQPLGNSEGNCATPHALYESALRFMATTTPNLTGGVYFTGDFVEAGASTACFPNGTTASTQRQVLDIIAYNWNTLRQLMPARTRIFGSLGNHDSVPGNSYGGTTSQAWQYTNLSSMWAPDLQNDPSALATVLLGGWFATQAAPGLTVVSLNVNYWCTYDNGNGAAELAEAQFTWLEDTLSAASSRGDAVHILGHEPPGDAAPREWSYYGGVSGQWKVGYWSRYTELCARFKSNIRGHFFGHVHTDQWTLLRSCANGTGAYIETTGIKFCSGGSTPDLNFGDLFGEGYDPISATDASPHCPIVPSNWTVGQAVAACERVCSGVQNQTCVGFTFYVNYSATDRQPQSVDGTTHWPVNECCFRTGSVARKPSCPTCLNRCYEKPPNQVCDGLASGVLLPAPALTEGFPATNPGIRLLEFDPTSFELLDAHTFTADLHRGNRDGKLDWRLEYSFREFFGIPDMSVESFENLSTKLLEGGDEWRQYMGRGDGSYFIKSYDAATASFEPKLGADSLCHEADVNCRAKVVSYLNATSLRP